MLLVIGVCKNDTMAGHVSILPNGSLLRKFDLGRLTVSYGLLLSLEKKYRLAHEFIVFPDFIFCRSRSGQ